MKERYLEVTFRKGRPFAAYLYLPRRKDDRSASVEPHAEGLLIDRAEDGRVIGIEISDPSATTLEEINRLLADLALEPMTAVELAPLGMG